jgi:hypothetical protein
MVIPSRDAVRAALPSGANATLVGPRVCPRRDRSSWATSALVGASEAGLRSQWIGHPGRFPVFRFEPSDAPVSTQSFGNRAIGNMTFERGKSWTFSICTPASLRNCSPDSAFLTRAPCGRAVSASTSPLPVRIDLSSAEIAAAARFPVRSRTSSSAYLSICQKRIVPSPPAVISRRLWENRSARGARQACASGEKRANSTGPTCPLKASPTDARRRTSTENLDLELVSRFGFRIW